MSDYCGVNSSHVRLLPREDVFVMSQEMGKGASEVFRKLKANVGKVFKVIIQRYRLQLFRGLRSGVHLVAHVELVQLYVINRFLLHGCTCRARRTNCIEPNGNTFSLENPCKWVLTGSSFSLPMPILSKVKAKMMSAELPSSIRTRWTVLLATTARITRGSSWGC